MIKEKHTSTENIALTNREHCTDSRHDKWKT